MIKTLYLFPTTKPLLRISNPEPKPQLNPQPQSNPEPFKASPSRGAPERATSPGRKRKGGPLLLAWGNGQARMAARRNMWVAFSNSF